MVDTRTERLDQIAQDYCENIGIYTAANSIRAVAAERDRLREVSAELVEALRGVLGDIVDYERINNLAATPGKIDCWQSVTHARAAIAKATGGTG